MAEADVVAIWNVSLTRLGDAQVADTSDVSPEAVACNQIWDKFRKKFLADHAWSGSKKTVLISAHANAPVARYTKKYAMPADQLRILRVDGKVNEPNCAAVWEIEYDTDIGARAILTDQFDENGQIAVEYIFDLDEAGIQELSEATQWAMALEFSAHLAVTLGKGESVKQAILAEAVAAVEEAKAMDSHEGTPTRFVDETLIDVRLR